MLAHETENDLSKLETDVITAERDGHGKDTMRGKGGITYILILLIFVFWIFLGHYVPLACAHTTNHKSAFSLAPLSLKMLTLALSLPEPLQHVSRWPDDYGCYSQLVSYIYVFYPQLGSKQLKTILLFPLQTPLRYCGFSQSK